MYREPLEKNGIRIKENYLNVSIPGMLSYYFYEFNDKPIEFVSRKSNVEQACRQYVKENGFRLEWFDDLLLCGFPKEKYISDMGNWMSCDFRDVKYNKLIADLYANDIEIIYG